MTQNTKTGEDQTTMAPEQKNTTQSEHGQTSAQEQESKLGYGKIVEVTKIEKTPFHLVKLEEGKCFITLGNNRISEIQTINEALELINNQGWELITSLVTLVTERVYEAIQREDKARNTKDETGYDTMMDK